jgi:hypothetical protein
MSVTTESGIGNHFVFIQLPSRSIASGTVANRLALKVVDLTISTSRQVMSFPTPGLGVLSGESIAFALDVGMSDKSISMSGTITEQTIVKKFEDESLDVTVKSTDTTYPEATENNSLTTVNMTAYEVAQLIHSYVDSSFLQRQQNFNELVILIPSYVSKYWLYHDGLTTAQTLETAKLIPWNYAVRSSGANSNKLDDEMTTPMIGKSIFPDPVTSVTADIQGQTGYIRSFSTTMTGGSPSVEFTMDFAVTAEVGFS